MTKGRFDQAEQARRTESEEARELERRKRRELDDEAAEEHAGEGDRPTPLAERPGEPPRPRR